MKVFLVTGGTGGAGTTEILQDKKWTLLKNGNLDGNAKIYGMKLATIDNEIFSFGKIWNIFFFIHSLFFQVDINFIQHLVLSPLSSNSTLLKGHGTINPIT